MTQAELLSVAQFAHAIERTPRTVINLIQAGRIVATKVGEGRTSAYVISREELERFQKAS